jgi:hypothetical protein
MTDAHRAPPAAMPPDPDPSIDHTDDDQIAERLRWTPKQRLDYLLDMLEFEERARRARRLS